MWFAKWFGRDAENEHENDEPARFSAPQPPVEAVTDARLTNASKAAGSAKPKKGFDPYNSGAFERKNAWERTNLR
jgi:hypothetical protein